MEGSERGKRSASHKETLRRKPNQKLHGSGSRGEAGVWRVSEVRGWIRVCSFSVTFIPDAYLWSFRNDLTTHSMANE